MHPVITPPIFVVEGDDVSAFRTIADAERALEEIDVDDGIYLAWDSSGRVLALTTGFQSGFPGSMGVHITAGVPERVEPDALRSLLVRVLHQYAQLDTASSSLQDVLSAFLRWASYSR